MQPADQSSPDSDVTQIVSAADIHGSLGAISPGPTGPYPTGPAWPPAPPPGYALRPGEVGAPTSPGSHPRRAGVSTWTGRLVTGLIGIALVLIGATAGITVWISHAAATTVAASPAPPTVGSPAHAAGSAGGHGTSAPAGSNTSKDLLSHYLDVLNAGNGDAVGPYLCASTGTTADNVWGFSWTVIYLHEHVDAGQTQPIQSRIAVQLTVSFNGQPGGQYVALLAQQDNRWCVQQVTGGGA